MRVKVLRTCSDHDPDLCVHFLLVYYNGWWREAVILWLVVEGLGDYGAVWASFWW